MKTSKEMNKLIDYLVDSDIPFEKKEFEMFYDESSLQLFYPSRSDVKFDIVCHRFSSGGENGLLEIMDHNSGDTLGCLDAECAFTIIKDHFTQNYNSLQDYKTNI